MEKKKKVGRPKGSKNSIKKVPIDKWEALLAELDNLDSALETTFDGIKEKEVRCEALKRERDYYKSKAYIAIGGLSGLCVAALYVALEMV